MFERWLVASTPTQISIFKQLSDAITGVGKLTSPVSDCEDSSVFPDIPRMIKFARTHELSWDPASPSKPYASGAALDEELRKIDPSYICLGMRGAAHFRLPGVPAIDALMEPTVNGIRWYGMYHAQALEFAQIGAQSPDTSVKEKFWGLATLFELFALHFLEDAGAAGHIASDASTLNTDTVHATHDYYNSRGLGVRLPRDICDLITAQRQHDAGRFSRLQAICEREAERAGRAGVRARVRGDHSIGSAMWLKDPEDVTHEIVPLLVASSLREVVETGMGVEGNVLAPDAVRDEQTCRDAVLRCSSQKPGALLVASCSNVWEEQACLPGTNAVVSRTLARGKLSALSLLPIAAQAAPPRTDFSGNSWEIGSSLLLSHRNSESPSNTVDAGLSTGLAWFSPTAPGGLRVAGGLHGLVFASSLKGGAGGNESYLGGGLWATVSHEDIPYPLYVGLGADFLAPTTSNSPNASILHLHAPMGIEYGRFENVVVRFQVGAGFMKPLAHSQPWTFAGSFGVVVHMREFPQMARSAEKLKEALGM
jgi:hypothetical protein